MAGSGGARHFKKPFLETRLLMNCLKNHEEQLKDFKGYEPLAETMVQTQRDWFML